jgi:hypothetical protein
MSNPKTDDLLVRAVHAEDDAKYWRERCAKYEAHHAKLEHSAAAVRGAVEQFLIVLQNARPQGTEPRA